MSVAEAEGQWMASPEADMRARFLASLGHELTIIGRAVSYEVGTDRLTRPEVLRHVNEIQHRVSACSSQLLRRRSSEDFELSIAKWVLEAADSELRGWTLRAWTDAKAHAQCAT